MNYFYFILNTIDLPTEISHYKNDHEFKLSFYFNFKAITDNTIRSRCLKLSLYIKYKTINNEFGS